MKNYNLNAVVEAMQVVAPEYVNADESPTPPGNMQAVADWANTHLSVGHDRSYEVAIYRGRHGPSYARHGEWVLKYANGKTDVLDDEAFTALFVEVDDEV